MSKLPEEHRFLDLSDYGRPAAKWIAGLFKKTSVTPVDVTLLFIMSGLGAIYAMLEGWFIVSATLLVLKSILDAADGELARIKNTPSYTGRYLDSVADIILNLLFVLSIWHITEGSLIWALISFLCIQLQGTLYNYYYVILRNRLEGDMTSRVFETEQPIAIGNESQKAVDILYGLYTFMYSAFDRTIYALDRKAANDPLIPNWLMTAVSTFGLGFQLLMIGIMLVLGLADYIIPFFIAYTIMLPVFILIRRSTT